MHDTELKTFIQKFNQLWKAGLNSHLDLDCHAGRAWVGLRLQLGQAPGPLYQQFHPRFQQSKESPSRQRRRARRAAAAKQKLVEEVNYKNIPTNETIVIDIESNHESEARSDILENERKLLTIDIENLKQQNKALEQKINDQVIEINQVKNLEKRIVNFKVELEVLKNENDELKLTMSQKELKLAAEEPISRAGDDLYNCELCDKKYKFMIGLNKHIASKHETLVKDTEVKCEYCSKTFQTNEMLKKHNEENQFGCDDCFICFETQFHADLHEIGKHPDSVDAAKYIPNSTKQLFLDTKR